MSLRVPRHYLVSHDLNVTQSPDFLAKPSGFLPKSCHFGRVQGCRQSSECAPKTAKSYTKLMWPFRIGKILNHRYVGGDLLVALVQYVVGGLLRLLTRTERDRFGIPRHKRMINLTLLEHIAVWLHWRRQETLIRLFS